jgi:hypothetical protein
MKLPPDAVVAYEKVAHYLLVRQDRSDKSAFLALGGYSPSNPDALIAGLTEIRDREDAQLVDENDFGLYYEAVGVLRGPSWVALRVRTIWLTERLSGTTRFITLIPIEVLAK